MSSPAARDSGSPPRSVAPEVSGSHADEDTSTDGQSGVVDGTGESTGLDADPEPDAGLDPDSDADSP